MHLTSTLRMGRERCHGMVRVRMGCLHWDDWDEVFVSSAQQKLRCDIFTLDCKAIGNLKSGWHAVWMTKQINGACLR